MSLGNAPFIKEPLLPFPQFRRGWAKQRKWRAAAFLGTPENLENYLEERCILDGNMSVIYVAMLDSRECALSKVWTALAGTLKGFHYFF